MTTMQDSVKSTLDRLNGGRVGLLGMLAADLTTSDDMMELVNPVPNVAVGTVVSVGLETLYVTRVVDAGKKFEFMRIGSYGEDVPVSTLVRFSPAQTNADVFERLAFEIKAMSSPTTGIYQVFAVDNAMNYTDGAYYLPPGTASPIRVLAVRGLEHGQDRWHDLNGWVWLADRGAVQFYSQSQDYSLVRVLYAMPFTTPTSLDDDLDTLGLHPTIYDIPVLGACANLALGLEGRRINPTSQGDPRRAGEISMTAGSSLAREFRRAQADRILEESSRLMALYPWRRQDLSGV